MEGPAKVAQYMLGISKLVSKKPTMDKEIPSAKSTMPKDRIMIVRL